MAETIAPTEKRFGSSAEQLLNATAALLSERRSLDVTQIEIAKRSGQNSAMIRHYFGNKEGLLLALPERVADIAMKRLTISS